MSIAVFVCLCWFAFIVLRSFPSLCSVPSFPSFLPSSLPSLPSIRFLLSFLPFVPCLPFPSFHSFLSFPSFSSFCSVFSFPSFPSFPSLPSFPSYVWKWVQTRSTNVRSPEQVFSRGRGRPFVSEISVVIFRNCVPQRAVEAASATAHRNLERCRAGDGRRKKGGWGGGDGKAMHKISQPSPGEEWKHKKFVFTGVHSHFLPFDVMGHKSRTGLSFLIIIVF